MSESLMLSLIAEPELRRMREELGRLVAQVDAELARRSGGGSAGAPRGTPQALPAFTGQCLDLNSLLRAALPESKAGAHVTKPQLKAALLSHADRLRQTHGDGHPEVQAVARVFSGKYDVLSDWLARNRGGKNPLLKVVTQASGQTPGVYELNRDL